MKTKKHYEVLRRKYAAEGDLAYSLAVFGDELAKRNGYKVHRDIDAVHFYIAQKYSWPPSQVRAMSSEDLRFLLDEEMHGWTMPKEAL